MNGTPSSEIFDTAYETYSAPWVIGKPQPAVVELETEGMLREDILDIGCGAGEHTIYLSQRGYSIVGVDASRPAVEYAKKNARNNEVAALFEVADAMSLGTDKYDTILDSALFHIFDSQDRIKYVASLKNACRPGGLVYILALSDDGPGFGPEVSEADITQAFDDGWKVEEVRPCQYISIATAEHHVSDLGLEKGQVVNLPAWLARVRRV
ncbi:MULTISPECIES: class I SAM-dependent methyltransferase [unclassified Halomonas]|uniref:class I SAM-dependent methyltransferase n=1 Tax=unclassified Halomonas TaxID=2609666 RepID=UPI000990446F|nr:MULTISPECIES: class I SAM-dependent methyltransferase [unclassified Halomonas]AQU82181.1 SAM-dependent methyltransferase [Halomonas sp. 'Soap Lake \